MTSPLASSTSRLSALTSIASMPPSEIVEMPLAAHENEARFPMLEKLADYDDELMEQLRRRCATAARQGVQ